MAAMNGGCNKEKSDRSRKVCMLNSLLQVARKQAIDQIIDGMKAVGVSAEYRNPFHSETIMTSRRHFLISFCAIAISLVPIISIGKIMEALRFFITMTVHDN